MEEEEEEEEEEEGECGCGDGGDGEKRRRKGRKGTREGGHVAAGGCKDSAKEVQQTRSNSLLPLERERRRTVKKLPERRSAPTRGRGSDGGVETVDRRKGRKRRERERERGKGEGAKGIRSSGVKHGVRKEEKEEKGCLKCRKDNDYENLLLCDGCSLECHTYCQYPKLWSIPSGDWLCPYCRESMLIVRLKSYCSELQEGRSAQERLIERQQQKVARLERSGLLLQNIILNEDNTEDKGHGLASRRSKRAKKDIDYAQLNDVYLPPLSPSDYIHSTNSAAEVTGSLSTQRNVEKFSVEGGGTGSMPVRQSRRLRGIGTVERIPFAAKGEGNCGSTDDTPGASEPQAVVNSNIDVSKAPQPFCGLPVVVASQKMVDFDLGVMVEETGRSTNSSCSSGGFDPNTTANHAGSDTWSPVSTGERSPADAGVAEQEMVQQQFADHCTTGGIGGIGGGQDSGSCLLTEIGQDGGGSQLGSIGQDDGSQLTKISSIGQDAD